MKLNKALMIGFFAVSSALVPSVSNALTEHSNQSVEKNSTAPTSMSAIDLLFKQGQENIMSKETINSVKLNLNTLLDDLGLKKVTHSHDHNYDSNFDSQDKKNIDMMKAIYSGKDISKIFENSPQKNNVLFSDNLAVGAFALPLQEACLVNVGVNDDGFTEKVDYDNYINKDLLKKVNLDSSDKDLYNEFVVRHEISHCRFTDYEHPLAVSNKKSTNDFANGFLLYASPVTGATATSMINEAYADTLSAIQMMVKYGVDNNELNKVLAKINTNRESKAIDGIELAPLNDHDVHGSMKLVLTKEYKDKIKNFTLNDTSAMENMALQASNEALVYKLAHLDSYQQNLVLSLANVQKAAIDVVALQVFKDNLKDFKRGVLLEGVNTKVGNSPGLLKDVAQEHIEEMKKSDRYQNYKEALIKISEKSSDKSPEGLLSFAVAKTPYLKVLMMEEQKIKETMDKKSIEKFGYSLTSGMEVVMAEMQEYKFSQKITTENKKEMIEQRAAENYTPANLKFFKFPADMAEKMERIHQNITNKDNQQLLGKTGYQMK